MGWFQKVAGGSRTPSHTSHQLNTNAGAYYPPAAAAAHPKASIMMQEEAEPPRYIDPTDLEPQGSMANNSLRAYPTMREIDLEVPKSFSTREDYSEEPPTPSSRRESSSSKANHLNSLFNGHLMKWKLEAEEGNSFIRVPAFFGALGLMVTAIVALVLYPDAWEPHSIVTSVGVIIMSLLILILDGRFLAQNPLSARAHLRNVTTRNFNILRFVWGRGLLYIVSGILNCAQLWLMTIISGAFMIMLGIVALCVGIHASRKFASLRNSLADESYLLLVFSRFDGDGDGYIAPNEFAILLAELGMELDDRYTLKAFNVIDQDNDRKISFDEFNYWWASGYIERGRRRRDSEDDYRQMD
ncbi:hypothetical protein MPSEU_000275000 [Mayamaea pseudoterrestris]|nr:hypothetical protein MPSEU_000275000 [Mayamaea pseudoterrestris]